MRKYVSDFFSIIKKLYFVLTKEQRIQSLWIFFMMIVSSLLELLGVSIIVPLLELFTDYSSLVNRNYVKWMLYIYPEMEMKDVLLLLSIVLIIIYIVKNLVILYSSYIQTDFSTSFSKDNSIRMLESYLAKQYEYFTNVNSSIILRGIGGDINGTYRILENLYGILSDLLTILFIGIFLFYTDWLIALLSLSLASLCLVVIIVSFKNKMKVAGKTSRDAVAKKNKCSYQTITGIKEVYVNNSRKHFLKEYESACEEDKKATLTNSFLSACPDRIVEAFCVSGIMLIIFFRISIMGDYLTFIPVLGSFAMGAFRILPSFAKISSKINKIVFDVPCLNNCYNNMVVEKKGRQLLDQPKEEKLTFEKGLSLCNIYWKYKNSDKYVLEGINIHIDKGSSVAFIGQSGAGKTTLADIILGLYCPKSGEVIVDNANIYNSPQNWAKMVGYVPQAVYLLDDTIRRNVAFGKDSKCIDDNKIWEALEKAQLKEFVNSLPDRLDTIVGERGIKFSGGQRQRIAIARALYENPEIIVLDEATSALDNETEEAVMEAINNLKGKKTLIIVAHRLSTIEKCDQVYEIVNGKAILKE